MLDTTDTIIASELTVVECRRVLHRAALMQDLSQTEVARLVMTLETTAAHWMRTRISEEIIERACRQFPVEPVRTLDAIHLATAIRTRRALPDLKILALDRRIRANREAIGFEILPEQAER